MKAVILAAGQSSRFFPFNSLPHKAFFPIMGKPIIEYTLESVRKSGISDVIIVVSPGSSIPDLLGDGKRWNLSISYATQKEANGQGDAILAAQEFIDDDFFVLNAYRCDFIDYKKLLSEKKQLSKEVVLLGKRENILGKFGIAKVENDRVVDLVEKPETLNPESDVRVLGIYLFNKEFLEVLNNTPPEHYHLEKALALYAKEKTVRIALTETEAFSLKYAWDLLTVKKYLLNQLDRSIAESAQIAASAQIDGNVVICDNAKILEHAVIKGPCYIGDSVVVGNNALVRNHTVLEKNSTVGMNAEAKNVILGEKSSIHSGSLEDSVVGSETKIGAFFCSSNVRIDRTNVTSEVKGKKVDTGLRSFGTCVGDGTKIGARVTTMPGVLIGSRCIIGPSTTVMKNLEDGTKYYTKFQELVEKIGNG